MVERKTLPVIIISSDIVLPGGTISTEILQETLQSSLKASEEKYSNEIVILFSKNYSKSPEELLPVGLFGILTKNEYTEDHASSFEIDSKCRAVLVNDVYMIDDYLATNVVIYHDDEEFSSLDLKLQQTFQKICDKIRIYGKSFLKGYEAICALIDSLQIIVANPPISVSLLCDIIAANIDDIAIDETGEVSFRLEDFLLETNLESRLNLLLKYLEQLSEFSQLDLEIENKLVKELQKEQKEYYLKKKIRLIQEELGEVDNATADYDRLKDSIDKSGMPEKIKEHVLRELKRYKNTITASPESSMIRAYLDLMIKLPWTKETEDILDIELAKQKLDETHFGLEKVKERILDYLSVKLYSGKNPQTILCLAGAPGVGKTTLAKSVAEALGRKFVKQSMGGVKDEAEIRGHRRTYIGALPGRIINGIKEAGVINPVFLLDEIDKIGSDYKGDPSAALLEVLDPEQNAHFMDHYLEVEYDLSKVLFICTANYLENIPEPLRDRMEIIELSSYTELEKLEIARNYTVQKSLKKNGLEKEKFEITEEALKMIIKYYTREAGARQLERNIDTIVRKSIKKILAKETEIVHVDENLVNELLGKKLYTFNKTESEDRVGLVNGLAWTAAGGDTLQIEVASYLGKGEIQLTGKLGDVMKESAQIALSYVKAHAAELSIDLDKLEKTNIHIHVPEGAVPKDGPSAGITLTTAIISLLTNKPVKHDLGMTGEITLRGRVLPIGGLKEKSIAAHRNGLKTILIPEDNIKDTEDIPQEVRDNLTIIPVSDYKDVLKIVF